MRRPPICCLFLFLLIAVSMSTHSSSAGFQRQVSSSTQSVLTSHFFSLAQSVKLEEQGPESLEESEVEITEGKEVRAKSTRKRKRSRVDSPSPPPEKRPLKKESKHSCKKENETRLINLLTADEIRRTYEKQSEKNCVLTSNGCLVNTLAPKYDGYVQINPMGIEKDSGRWKELLGPNAKAAVKVMWHQVAWRYYNDFRPVPYSADGNTQLAHSCSNRPCGARNHLHVLTRAGNESQKRCAYAYHITDHGIQFYLLCEHHPRCVPSTRESYPLTPVKDTLLSMELMERHVNIKQEELESSD